MRRILEIIALALALAGCFIIYKAIFDFPWHDLPNSKGSLITDAKFGSFGSFISGTVGTCWALAGVILFYVALTEQRRDMKTNQDALRLQTEALNQQISEFELQRLELEETRKVYIEQTETQKSQRFENTFFQLVNLHHNIVSAFDLRSPTHVTNVVAKGRDCFKILASRISNNFNNERYKDVVLIYISIYSKEQADLGHYFRNLYHIYKFLDKEPIGEKKRYSGFVRAQISAYELVLIFYNCLSNNGIHKFKPLIESYSVFKNLDLNLICGGKETIKRYKPQAFGHENFDFLDTIEDWT